ncbi:hypothetical protein [Rufibacter tibetensis]|uniref:Uncharacterized protein n=1 Tax=Rufibacter tibetensis TaxID=512763 RepID=A0A0P0CTF8_9BACT|nr:hypothetical protein [Rufibacter tibetensis]ALJ00794.1 hypothetical protein DC20_19660 [Rufibacter tibetensis]
MPKGIDFQQLRWHDVALCINRECNELSQEFKSFLKTRKLIMENFNYSDLATFQSFFDLRKKFNDILRNDISRLYTKKGLFSYYINQPTIRHNEYVLVYNYGREVNVVLGFGNWWGEHPCLFTRLWISHKKDKTGDFAKGVQEKMINDGWYLLDTDPNGYGVERRVRLIDFLQLEDNQRASIVNFFQQFILDLESVIPSHPTIFNLSAKPVLTEATETEI